MTSAGAVLLFGRDSNAQLHEDDVQISPGVAFQFLSQKRAKCLVEINLYNPLINSINHSPLQAEFPYDELRRVNFERKKDPLLLHLGTSDIGLIWFVLVCVSVSKFPKITLPSNSIQ